MDNLKIFIDQSVGVWQIIKWLIMGGALAYLVLMATSWDRRLLGGLTLSVLVFLLAGCTINEGATPADARIAASQADIAQIQANAEAQKQTAQLTAQQQAQQLNALQVAQEQAQVARSDAQSQQAQAIALQAQANQQQAQVMAGAITALDKANERATQHSAWLGWLLTAIVAGGLVIVAMWVYFKGKVAVASVQPPQPITDAQMLHMARNAGYLVEQTTSGKWVVLDPSSHQQISRKQLLLEVQG